MTDQTLAGFYQCFKKPASFLRTIQSFQKHYPESTIVVVNDGGYNYSEFCASNNIHYSFHPKKTEVANQLIFNSLEPILEFLERLWMSFGKIRESHIILLEDDVRIMRHHTMPFITSISGMNTDWNMPEILTNILRSKGYTGHNYSGACGGCVLDKAFFANIPFYRVVQVLSSLPTLKNYASDAILVFIALYFGGSLGPYAEFAESWYKNIVPLLVEDKVAFLHKYQYDYGNEPTESERKLLGESFDKESRKSI